MYLSLNGTSDYLQLPTMTLKKITFDAVFPIQSSDLRMVLDARDGLTNGYVYARTSGTLTNAGGVFSETNFSFGSRITSDFIARNEFTDNATIFANKTFGENFKGDIYDIKCYDALSNLVAHYDMSTGTVDDQSGNGNHATLTGGTWVTESEPVQGIVSRIHADSTVEIQGELTENGTYNLDISGNLKVNELDESGGLSLGSDGTLKVVELTEGGIS